MRLRLVSKSPIPVVKGSLRPFRLMSGRVFLPHRQFGIRLNAHKAALWEINLAKAGTTIEVVDVDRGKLLGQYTKLPDRRIQTYWDHSEFINWKLLKKA